MCAILGALLAAGIAAPPSSAAQEDSSIWRWSDGEGGLHYTHWYEIPSSSRAKATRVEADIGEVGGNRPSLTFTDDRKPLTSIEPGVGEGVGRTSNRCAQLALLRRSSSARASVALRPEISEQTTVEEYVVDGATPRQIRDDMNAKRRGTFDAHTAWRVQWEFPRDLTEPARCRLRAPSIALRVTRVMPKLGPSASRDPVLAQHWARYLSALASHEAGHRDIGAAAANDILEALEAFSGTACSLAEVEASSCATSIIEEYQRIDAQYDRTTNHGMKDGARFP